MSHHLPTPGAALITGPQHFGAADTAAIDGCAQLMACASRLQQHRWTRQAAGRHIAALLNVAGAQAYVWRDGHGVPLCFVIGHAAGRVFRVRELCADESLHHQRISMALLEHVRTTVQASEIVLDGARGRRHARQLVRAL